MSEMGKKSPTETREICQSDLCESVYEEGKKAFYQTFNFLISTNPFRLGTDLHRSWYRGVSDARKAACGDDEDFMDM